MQLGLNACSPRAQRVGGGACPGWAGPTMKASDPASSFPQPPGLPCWAWPGPKERSQGLVVPLRPSDSVFCSLQPSTLETDYSELVTSYPKEDYSPLGSLSGHDPQVVLPRRPRRADALHQPLRPRAGRGSGQ